MPDHYDLLVLPDGSPALTLAGAAVREIPGTRSGNPHHEIYTGRFGNGPGETNRRGSKAPDRRALGGPPRRATDASRPDVARRRDSVVDASREVQDLSNEQALRAFMTKRWTGARAMTEADVQAFIADVHQQRLADLTDALYNRVQTGILQRAKAVRVDFPRGWLRGSVRGLSPDDLRVVLDRLRARGVSDQDLRRHVVSRLGEAGKALIPTLDQPAP